MVASFIQEQKRYTKKDLCKKFHCSEEKTTSITSRLQTFGFLRTVRYSNIQKDMTDLFNEDSEADDLRCSERECLYVFLFVGVLMVSDILLKCYPKYILHKSEPKDELRQILKVIEKYNAKEQRMPIFCETDESHSFHLLYVLRFLLRNYYENSLYHKKKDRIESNGSGEILWDRTVNENSVLLFSDGRPYYTNLQTRKQFDDTGDYFRRLHACILTMASAELKKAGLLDLFSLT